MSVCSFWSFSSGDGSEGTQHVQSENMRKRIIHNTSPFKNWWADDVQMCHSYLFSSLLSSQVDAQVAVLASQPETLSGQTVPIRKKSTQPAKFSSVWKQDIHGQGGGANLAVLSGWEGWHVLGRQWGDNPKEWQISKFLTSLCVYPQIAAPSSPSSPFSLLALSLSFVCLSFFSPEKENQVSEVSVISHHLKTECILCVILPQWAMGNQNLKVQG